MTVEEVSRGREVNREVKSKQRMDQPGEKLLEVENQGKIKKNRWFKYQPIIMQKIWWDNIKTERKKVSLWPGIHKMKKGEKRS